VKQNLREGRSSQRKVHLWRLALTFVIAKQGDLDPKNDANKEGDDLEMIGGTSEDDFSEAIALIR
jgi:hypothetical protein